MHQHNETCMYVSCPIVSVFRSNYTRDIPSAKICQQSPTFTEVEKRRKKYKLLDI